MKDKGFTLVEMLAVVIILALFGMIGIISVESIIRKGTEKAYQAQISEIKTAAENSIKIDGEPKWCGGENVCFISLRYLAFKKHIKLNADGEFINPKTNKSFDLENVAVAKKYGDNYVFEVYESLDELAENNASYLSKAKLHAVAASATIYKERGYCGVNCSFRVSDLVEKNLLSQGFYNNVTIEVRNDNTVEIG